MTIYTPGKVDKESTGEGPEVVTTDSEPLTCSKKDKDLETAKPVLRVTYFPRNQRRTFCVYLVLTIIALIILACGTIGAVIFYRHLNKNVYSGSYEVQYSDPEYQQLIDNGGLKPEEIIFPTPEPETPPRVISRFQNPGPRDGVVAKSSRFNMGFTEEGIEVSEIEKYEYLHMPFFEDVRETNVWHDFKTNFSAIIDAEYRECYIMPLDRTAIAPPRSLIDMLFKTMTGYYKRYAQVIHQSYRVTKELPDLTEFGSRIVSRCEEPGYDSFMVERMVSGVFKRSIGKKTVAYSMMNNFVDNPQLYKIYIH